jgi:hypothetical protein
MRNPKFREKGYQNLPGEEEDRRNKLRITNYELHITNSELKTERNKSYDEY